MSKRFTETDIPLSLTTYWTIMPKDTNYMFPLVFGGAMMSQVDEAAATHARMLLKWSDCDKTVTHKADFDFTAKSYSGDTIRFVSTLVEVRDNALKFVVEAFRSALPSEEKPDCVEFEQIGRHELVFVTMKGDKFKPHNLKKVLTPDALIRGTEAE